MTKRKRNGRRKFTRGLSRREALPPIRYCPHCGKESFDSRKDALKILNRRREAAARALKVGRAVQDVPKYVYRCEKTLDWHASKGEWKKANPNPPKKPSGIRVVHNFLTK